MAKDPLLNEQLIIAQLRDERTPVTPNMMRSLCSIVLMCSWDRKIEREFFGELLDDVCMIQIDLADLECAGRMRKFIISKEGDPAPLDTETEALVTGFMAKRRRLADKMDLISQCPTSTDNIH